MSSTLSTAVPGTPPRTAPPGRAAAALTGVVTVGLAVGIAELVAALGIWAGWLAGHASPVTALGSAFIQLTPEWLKEFAIETFGQHDKDALRVGMGLTLVVVAIGVGLIGRTRPRWAAGVLAAGVGLVIVAVLTRAGTNIVDALPTALGGVAGIAFGVTALRRTMAPPGSSAPEPPARNTDATSDGVSAQGSAAADNASAGSASGNDTSGRDTSGRDTSIGNTYGGAGDSDGERGRPLSVTSRRSFFRVVGVGALAAAAAGALSRWIPSTEQVMASRADISLPAPSDPQAPPDVGLHVKGLTSFLTANDDFYRVDTAFVVPRLTATDWRLRVHGMVDEPLEIDFAELLSMPMVERTITLSCVSNQVGGHLNGNATWLGVRIEDLLRRAGPKQGADCVLSTSVDGFDVSTPLEALTDGRDALLAVGMNGEPLPLAHGFPVRMVVPGLFGYVSATKWVVDMEVTKFSEVSAYWTDRGWSARGPIKTESRIDVPKGFAQLTAGPVAVAGMAWAQHRGIRAVEVQVDDGPWETATLSAPFSVDTWRQWMYRWDATPGQHTIRCRATDGTGEVQTSAVAPVLPDGATGYDSRLVTVHA